RHTRFSRDWSSDVCSSDLLDGRAEGQAQGAQLPRGHPADSTGSGGGGGGATGSTSTVTILLRRPAAASAVSRRERPSGSSTTDEIGRAACRETAEGRGRSA